jgi:hypothetical protein
MGSRSRFAVRREPPKIDMAAVAAQQAADDRARAEEARVTNQAIEAARAAYRTEDPLVQLMQRLAALEERVAELEIERTPTNHAA